MAVPESDLQSLVRSNDGVVTVPFCNGDGVNFASTLAME